MDFNAAQLNAESFWWSPSSPAHPGIFVPSGDNSSLKKLTRFWVEVGKSKAGMLTWRERPVLLLDRLFGKTIVLIFSHFFPGTEHTFPARCVLCF